MDDSKIPPSNSSPEIKWYYRQITVWISLLMIGPLALPLLWKSPQFSLSAKIIISIFIIALTVLLTWGTVALYAYAYNLLKESGIF